jgi:hypothetical protein
VDLTFNLNTESNKEFIRGRRIKVLPIDDWCSTINQEIIDEVLKPFMTIYKD